MHTALVFVQVGPLPPIQDHKSWGAPELHWIQVHQHSSEWKWDPLLDLTHTHTQNSVIKPLNCWGLDKGAGIA